MIDYLVISALGKDRPGIVNELSKAVLDSGCNITDSRMSVLGGEFALLLMVSGAAKAVEHMSDILPALEEKLDLTIIAKQTGQRESAQNTIPYDVEVVSMDHPGIVHEVASFFAARTINIEEMDTETYAAAHTGTPMFSLHMTVSLPTTLHIGRLRDEFADFCDALNLDATLEPAKH